METRKGRESELRASHSIWCVRGRQLIKCSPEKLRPASMREELVEALSQDQQTPWTYQRLIREIGGNQYQAAVNVEDALYDARYQWKQNVTWQD